MRRTMAWVGAVLVTVAAAGHGGTTPREKVAEADRLYDRWQGAFEFAEYEARLRGAITLWEEAQASEGLGEEQAAVLVRLARAYFELAEAYLPAGKRLEAYARGEAAALEALRLDPEFVRVERAQGFRAALASARDVGAVFWYGNNLGRSLNHDYGRAIFGGTRDVLAAFTRAIELDEGYWGGGPHRALANFLAQTPGFLGGDQARALRHFARAAELDPAFLQSYVDWAEFYARPRKEWDLFCQLLGTVRSLADSSGVVERWPLYNRLALARVEKLLAEAPRCCP